MYDVSEDAQMLHSLYNTREGHDDSYSPLWIIPVIYSYSLDTV